MSHNKLYISAAGSGKTTRIVKDALLYPNDRILITTFTLANEQAIRDNLRKCNHGILPANITVQTWFSFLLEHGVRPYRHWDERVRGMILVNTASGVKYTLKNSHPVYWGEDDFRKYYFNDNMDVYSDKLAKLVYNCNKNGYVFKRLERVFTRMYIDEAQDMAGWDLELIKLIMQSSIKLTMVADPRQTVYQTHHSKKYQKYADGKLKEFIENECRKVHCEIDANTLMYSYRNSSLICALSSKLYPEYPECESRLGVSDQYMGVFFVYKEDVDSYKNQRDGVLHLYQTKADMMIHGKTHMTFGNSKGLESKHVLIYPTKDMLKWLCGKSVQFKNPTKARLYVALTRAFFSVGIVVADKSLVPLKEISIWNNT